jgi:hypothetical protein
MLLLDEHTPLVVSVSNHERCEAVSLAEQVEVSPPVADSTG